MIPLGHKKCFYVPFTSDYLENKADLMVQRFAVLPHNKFKQLQHWHGSHYTIFKNFLIKESTEIVSLPTFFKPSEGIQFFLTNPSKIEELLKQGMKKIEREMTGNYISQIPLLMAHEDPIQPFQSSGLLVSSWIRNITPHIGKITSRFIQMSLDCVGRGYGNRVKSRCYGMNHYHGPRISDISTPSPVEGKGRSHMSEYFRNYFHNFHRFLILHRKWNMFEEQIKKMAEKMDFYFTLLLSSIETSDSIDFSRSPCSIGIFTCGDNKTLSFANEPHLDDGDKFTIEQVELVFHNLDSEIQKLDNIPNRFEEKKKKYREFQNYVTEFDQKLGLGVPTTCAYQHVLVAKEVQLIQFFLMEGLGCAVLIEDFVGHHFQGHAFVHHTSLCVGINQQGKVL